MYNNKKPDTTTLKVNKAFIGETLENKIARIVNNKEPIKDNSPIIYTERKDGVQPQYDIRADRMELAIDAMDKIAKNNLLRRQNAIAEQAKKNMETEQNQTNDLTKQPPNTSQQS